MRQSKHKPIGPTIPSYVYVAPTNDKVPVTANIRRQSFIDLCLGAYVVLFNNYMYLINATHIFCHDYVFLTTQKQIKEFQVLRVCFHRHKMS